MTNHAPKKQALTADRLAQQLAFLIGIEPRTRDNKVVFTVIKTLERELTLLTMALVDDMRETGASWADVGQALGITRQGAWEVYASRQEQSEGPQWHELET